jgi:hypothetical protein
MHHRQQRIAPIGLARTTFVCICVNFGAGYPISRRGPATSRRRQLDPKSGPCLVINPPLSGSDMNKLLAALIAALFAAGTAVAADVKKEEKKEKAEAKAAAKKDAAPAAKKEEKKEQKKEEKKAEAKK